MTMTTREKNKWGERHFRICLALLSRPAIPDGFGFTKPLVLQDVINKAEDDCAASTKEGKSYCERRKNINFMKYKI